MCIIDVSQSTVRITLNCLTNVEAELSWVGFSFKLGTMHSVVFIEPPVGVHQTIRGFLMLSHSKDAK